jgi:hypothetical protein
MLAPLTVATPFRAVIGKIGVGGSVSHLAFAMPGAVSIAHAPPAAGKAPAAPRPASARRVRRLVNL